MNEAARNLFSAWQAGLPAQAAALASQVRATLGAELIQRMSSEQQRELQSVLERAVHLAVDHFLGPFNNVGGVLKGEYSGYHITAHAPNRQTIDIGDGHTDYSDLWREYSSAPDTTASKQTRERLDEAIKQQMNRLAQIRSRKSEDQDDATS